jgi:hypothetical protein
MSVLTLFLSYGFTEVKLERMNDLTEEDTSLEGKVEDVSIDGDTNYATDRWVSEDSQVVIRYHSCPVSYTLPGMTTAPELSSAERAAMEEAMLSSLQINFVDFKVSFNAESKTYEFAPTGGEAFAANYSAALEGTEAQRNDWIAFTDSMKTLSGRLTETLGSGYSFEVFHPDQQYTILYIRDGYVVLDYVK